MLLDTSFLVDLLGGRLEARALAESVDESHSFIRLPAPAMYELWMGAGRSKVDPRESARLTELARAFEIVPLTAADARQAGLLQAELVRSGQPLGTIDILIAGMCIERNETLITGDRRLLELGHGLQARGYSPSK